MAAADGPVMMHVLADQHEGPITACIVVSEIGGNARDTGVLSVAEDKTLLVWLLRDNGEYYPSARKDLPSVGTAISFDKEANKIYVSLMSGVIVCFNVSSDWNGLTVQRTFQAHEGTIAGLVVDQAAKIVVSAGRDKRVRMHSTETGEKLAEYALPEPAYSLEYAPEATTVFVGDGAGNISILKVMERSSFKKLVAVAGHHGAVTAMHWEQSNEFLYSGGNDKLVVAWDMGGQKGHRYELRGQKSKIRALNFDRRSNQLLSVDEKSFFIWDMSAQRFSNPEWKESDTCMTPSCGLPFFWNVKKMWDDKDVALKRQHHCRACGNAICDEETCCHKPKTVLTRMGHETPVRVCASCGPKVADADRILRCKVVELPFKLKVCSLEVASPTLLLNTDGPALRIYNIQAGVIDSAGVTVAAYHKATSALAKVEDFFGGFSFSKLLGNEDEDTDSGGRGGGGASYKVDMGPARTSPPPGAATVYKVGGDDEEARPSLAASILNDQDEGVSSPFA
jgi:WD40 repeat protein